MDKDLLRNQIEKAFSGLHYPGNNDLTIHPLGFDEIFYESLINKSWKQLDSKLLNYHHDCIGVLTAKGFQYFIAAFLLEDIENDSPIADKLIWDFSQAILDNSSPIIGVSGKDWFNERMEVLSKEQRSSLASYFSFLKPLGDEEEKALIDTIVEAIDEI